MKIRLLAALALALPLAPAIADTPVNLATGQAYLSPDEVPAGAYAIETKETLIRYEVLHFGYSDYWGTFPGATGTLTIDPKHIEATKLTAKVPIFEVETTNRELNSELFSDEFFDAEEHPYLEFISTAVTRTGPRTAKVEGTLSMHNVTRPVTLDVTFNGGGKAPSGFGDELFIGFKAEGVVKRSDFGLGKFVPVVSDETRIVISSALKKAP